jgi:hypothetical protein
MLPAEIKTELAREPFIPLRLHLTSGKKLDVPFKGVATMVQGGLLVMKGVREGSRMAKGFDVVGYDKIARIEPHTAAKRSSGKGRKR